MKDCIEIVSAKTHNLKNINVNIPLNKITCVSGPSGSGKSSLVFHTLYQESKRRLLNSLPSSVKFFWDMPQTVDVQKISPVLPAWGLAQNNPVLGSRLIVADLLSLTERLQKVFFILGKNHCPEHLIAYKDEGLKYFLKKFIFKKRVIHIFINSSQYKSIYGENVFPNRCSDESGKICDFSEDLKWWEIVRIKCESEENIEKSLKK